MSELGQRPSIVLHGFLGGIINNTNVAQRLARCILEGLLGPEKVLACLPLEIRDDGDRWSITGADADGSNCRVVIRKSDAAILSLGSQSPPEVLRNEDTVEKFAAILAENAGDPAEVNQQLPFAITDRGDTWFVRGSRNADHAVEGPGAFCLEVRKRDARVLDMWFEGVLHTPPEVREALRRNK